MTKVSVMSDLHLEFHALGDLPGGDVLILAGDIWTARHMDTPQPVRERFEAFCRKEMAKYGRVLMVTGNHEPYGFNIDRMDETINAFLAEHAPHAKLLNNETEIIDGVAFLGTPLWATCGVGDPTQELAIRGGMNDFRLIRTNKEAPEGSINRFIGSERLFTPHDANEMHQAAVAWLADELPKHKRCVVIGHHAPSLISANGDRYGTQILDAAYCSNQHALIEANPQIAVWIHGHTHKEEHYRIGETLVIANPRGYFPDERRSRNFEPGAEDFMISEIMKAAA